MLDYWYKKFGPLYSLWLGNQLFVIISDPGIAKDLFVTNGIIFSSVCLLIKENDIFPDSPFYVSAQGNVHQVANRLCRPRHHRDTLQ